MTIYKEVIFTQEEYKEQLNYWRRVTAGDLEPVDLPVDNRDTARDTGEYDSVPINFSRDLSGKLSRLSKNTDITLYLVLLAAFKALLFRYTGNDEILTVSPPLIIDEEDGTRKRYNKRVLFRDKVDTGLTFKELLISTKNSALEAYKNQDYPLELVFRERGADIEDYPFLDRIIFLLSGIHDENAVQDLSFDWLICFTSSEGKISGSISYNGHMFKKAAIKWLVEHYVRILDMCTENVNIVVKDLEILSETEIRRLLKDFNNTRADYPTDKTLHRLVEEQVARTPDRTAVVFGEDTLTYRELNEKANQLASYLRRKGVGPDHIVGIMMEDSLETVIGILGVLKAGGAYLPVNPGLPVKRIAAMLEDSGVRILITKEELIKEADFIALQNGGAPDIKKIVTPTREQVMTLDDLQIPDRSLVDYEKYHPFIGQSMVKNSITVQFSRGCVFKCLYCFKIWPDRYALRSAENLFEEVQLYYNMGIRRFGFTDDLPNFNRKEIAKFYRLIIKNRMKLHLHFPNGIRGDVLTKEHIDLMVEAGAVTMDLALETASQRLQKLLRKNVNIDRLRDNVQYIIDNYPHVILGVQIMHGFPTESEEEARASLEFIKDFRWLPFGYMHILKIYPNTAMARFATENGILEEAILKSVDLGYHELPETLPFPKSFTRQCQSEYLGDFFLRKERLINVLPHQMAMLTEDELVQKYDSYLPADIGSFKDLLNYTGISGEQVKGRFLPPDFGKVDNFNEKVRRYFPVHKSDPDAARVLLLDLSQHFSDRDDDVYAVVDPPLGLMYLQTHLHKTFKGKVKGKIAKSMIDFDNYDELKQLIARFKPDIIGIRALSFFKDFFHKTLSLIRLWGIDVPVIAGGPYATSSYRTMLRDFNIDLAVLGEGEITFEELVREIMKNGGRLPHEEVLKGINGLAFARGRGKPGSAPFNREILMLDRMREVLSGESRENPTETADPHHLAYVIYTSGSTGTPKGVMIEHRNVVNQVTGLRKRFGFDDSLNYLMLASFSFDVSVMHLFSALSTGAKIHLISDGIKKDPMRLWPFIHEKGINILNIVPAFMNALLENMENRKIHFKYLFVGGDVFTGSLYRALKETFTVENMMNIYGPTETTINAAVYLCGGTEEGETLPIGKPLTNYSAYILDKDLNLVPVGVKGELYISGEGVARGYLEREALTARSFIENPHLPGKLMYRTGDLARWLPDGNIEFSGRVDHQVKIRGFRVELGEIENRLTAHNSVKNAVVVVKEDRDGDKYLSAFVVRDKGASLPDLKAYLSEELPDYMVPGHIVEIDKIPLNAAGKLDRKCLPDPKIRGTRADYAAPGSEIEKKLVIMWSNVLGLEENNIGIDANFFELGGHSLRATILVSRIHKEFNVEVSIPEIFETPTVRGLAKRIQGRSEDKFISIEPAAAKEYYSLSSAQKRLYVLHRMNPSNTNYNMPGAAVLEGEPDREKLERTFRQLINRHESLRTSFAVVGEEPVQKIHADMEFELEEPAVFPGNGNSLFRSFIRPFDLSHAPLLRVGLFKEESARYILMIDMHHIISDGTSIGIFFKEFMALYKGETLTPLDIQYKDYSRWQNRSVTAEKIKKQEEYWVKQFEGEIPVLDLPTDNRRPGVLRFEGGSLRFDVGAEETRALKKLAGDGDATLFMVLLAAFTVLMAKLSGQEDIVVGTPVEGRRHDDLRRMIGMFVNTLPLRNVPAGDKTFGEFLKQLRARTLEAFENQEYPFEELVEKVAVKRDTGRNPLFDVMFGLRNIDIPAVEIPGLKLTPYDFELRTSKFDISLYAVESEETLTFNFEYGTALFEPETIERFRRYFLRVISAVTGNADTRISDIELLDGEEKRRVLYEFNDTESDYPRDRTIDLLFEEQVTRTPNNTAVIFDDTRMTYRGLNEKADRLAWVLRDRGVKPGDIVGVVMKRSFEMMAAVFGILKAGGGYLPVDPTYPRKRKEYLSKDSGVRLVLAGENADARSFGESEVINLSNGTDVKLHEGMGEIDVPVTRLHGAGDAAYVIYTSGSTGKPKGVVIRHQSLVNRLNWMQRRYPMGEEDVVLQKTPIVFDVSVWELFWWSFCGASVSLLAQGAEKSPAAIIEAMEKNRVTTMHFVPSMLDVFMEYLEESGNPGSLASLRQVFASGEELKGHHVARFNRLFDRGNRLRLTNLYGPTEATVDVSYFDCPREEKEGDITVPIGKPIDNTRLYVLDKNLRPQPVGIAGELYIAGDGLAKGYLNRVELTAERFNRSYRSYKSYKTYIRYKTGDLARWLPDGNIEFLGRMDYQVKVRGNRIETGEIEALLAAHETVKEAVVTAKEEENGVKYLCAYIVSHGRPSVSQLREFLSEELPPYMIPSLFVQLEKMPLTPNGKVDRKNLDSWGKTLDGGEEYAAPETRMGKLVAGIWQDILKVDKVGLHDNFFDLGGNSFKLIRINRTLNLELGKEIPLMTMFEYPSVGSLASYLEGEAAGNEPDTGNMEQFDLIQEQAVEKMEDALQILTGGFDE